MSVSSVKNLNGESFSAVQDAELTDIVSSNSAIWNEASAIADKLDASSTDNSNIQYNDNKLYVKAVSSYGIEVIATGHMNGNIVYDEPFNLGTPHCFSSKYGAGGPIFGFSAFDENDILLYTASSDNINGNYKLSRYNMKYVGYGVAGAHEMAPIKYFSFSCSNTHYDNSGISAYKNISATGYSTSDEFTLAKNVIRNEGNGENDVYSKDGNLILTSPYDSELQIYANGMSVFNHLGQNVSNINSSTIGLGYSSDNNDYKFYVNASQYSSDHVIRLKDVITANMDALCTNYMTANYTGISAVGLNANSGYEFYIRCQPEIFSGGGATGFTFSSENTGFGTAQLTTAYGNQIVRINSPKFEARNTAGAGFSIEASAAKGYDHNGNVVWDTSVAPAPAQLIVGADSPKPNILLSPYMPRSMSAQFSGAPLLSADGNGIYIGISGQNVKAQMGGLTSRNGIVRTELADNLGNIITYSYLTGTDVGVYHSSAFNPSGSWSLTGSVQKREIEGDSATSAITAIAGSAVGAYNETVLFDGVISSNETAMLSEPASAFERIKVYGYLGTDLENQYYPWYTECTTTSGYIRAGAWTNDPFYMNCFCFIINPSGGFINATGRACAFGQTAWNVIDNWATTKVIGVNRKPIVAEEQTEE